MRLAVIGHQIKFLPRNLRGKIHDCVIDVLLNRYPEIVDIYMTPGIGFWAAEWCEQVKTPYRVISPFKQSPLVWPVPAQHKYNALKKSAIEVVYVDRQPGYILRKSPPDEYKKEKLFNMARWMATQLEVENGDELLFSHIQPQLPLDDIPRKDENFIALAALSALGQGTDSTQDGIGLTVGTKIAITPQKDSVGVVYRQNWEDIPF
jgi:hypothetical protein